MSVHTIADAGAHEALISGVSIADHAAETFGAAGAFGASADRRREARETAGFDVWMIGHEASTILRCRCDNSAPGGLHLVAPLGYGIAEGQRYELRSRPPGSAPMLGFNIDVRRWARVVRTEIVLGEGRDQLGVGVEFDE